MREILFRGRSGNEKWRYGSLLVYPDGDCFICIDNGEETDVLIKSAADSDTVGQYTGLTDKNGVKIFEGDIVDTDLKRPYLIVEFRDGCFMVNCNDGGEDYYDIMLPIAKEQHMEYKYGSVIGNIYDNPELLKGGVWNVRSETVPICGSDCRSF